MKKLIFLLLLFPSILRAQTSQEETIYHQIYNFYKKQFPAQFKAQVISKEFDKTIKKIPMQYWVNPGITPEVLFFFKRDLGIKFFVSNVLGMYRNKFSDYNNFFTFIKPFISIESYQDFSQHYTIIAKENNSFLLQNKIEESDFSYLLFFGDKGEITQIKEYKNKKETQSFLISYEIQNNYFLMKQIIITNQKSKIMIDFTNYDLLYPLNEGDFLG